jgi:hypothetical protein
MPNVWWGKHNVRRRIIAGGVAAALLGIGLVTPAVASSQTTAHVDRVLPEGLVPADLQGFVFTRRLGAEVAFRQAGGEAMVSTGRVYTLARSDIVEGTVQLSLLKRSLDLSRPRDLREVFHGIRDDMGNGRFVRTNYDGQNYYWLTAPGQRIYAWFTHQGRDQVVELVVLRGQFGVESSDALVHALIDAQLGKPAPQIPLPSYEQSPRTAQVRPERHLRRPAQTHPHATVDGTDRSAATVRQPVAGISDHRAAAATGRSRAGDRARPAMPAGQPAVGSRR